MANTNEKPTEMIKLKVMESLQEDAYKGIARINTATMRSLGVKPGDVVITVSHSFIATANAVIHSGAIPIFADVDLETGNITAETIEKVISKQTKAVITVHQIGIPADLDPIMDLCKKRKG